MHDPIRWASKLIQAFYTAGVRHAVISPGSRSTPLTMAVAVHPGLHKKIVLDERSAGFIALGIGKATGKAALLICTSGTAVANYMPAVIEAKESGTPMVILSADRPPNLRGIGSSQTVDQLKIFGDQAIFFHEAGEPAFDDDDFKRLRFLAQQATETAITKGGAAHINLPFRKPLEPTSEQLKLVIEESEKNVLNRDHKISSIANKSIHLSGEIIDMINKSQRPLIIAGPANPHQALLDLVLQLSNSLNCPVVAEPGSNIISDMQIDRFDRILRNTDLRKQLKPDLILQFGDQPFTKPVLSAVETWHDVPVLQFISRDAWQDHFKRVLYRIILNPSDDLDLQKIKSATSDGWFERWKKHDHHSKDLLKKSLDNTDQLTDGHIFNYIYESIEKDWNVMLSNSFPARDMAQFGSSSVNQFVNRGAAGIDGILSTAAGIAESSEKPVFCLLGDLAFLHDSNALFSLKSLKAPVVTVVINNGGGTIFQMLPVYTMLKEQNRADLFQTYFQTPQDVNIQFLANASGLPYLRVEKKSDLEALDFKSIGKSMIIECVTDADASMKLRESF
ncbi:MAG: 2-succinyl-5-enolpyruvyl-6-hydroxy-3-cyclohexene-1-carboxylic-acid synthase [Balneolaceae bacterium]|nr:2-succinyl-5-enolpyruvyl-6-hydroxy-3-cyclohexene-1-carboxylic-acid synthase [Balneolaceae bacterium]